MSEDRGTRVLTAIQAYNCGTTVGRVVRQCLSHVPDVLVMDDGSDDDTGAAAQAAGARVLRHERNQGKGAAIRAAAAEALRNGYSALLTIDGDGQHDGHDLPEFLEAHRRSPETLWIGWRREALQQAPVARRLGNRFSNRGLDLLAGVRLPDTQCGLRLYPTDLLRCLSLRGTRYEAEVEILIKARALGWQMQPLPVRIRFADGRPTSHYRPWVDTARICSLVARHSFQRLITTRRWLAVGLAATHAPLVVGAIGAIGLSAAMTPALIFHLAMTASLLRPRSQIWVDTEVDFRPMPGRAEIALTFDDGPDRVATPRVLDVLERAQVPATFFLIGRNAQDHPDLVADIAARGHGIGNHTYHHLHGFSLLGATALAEEVDRAQEAIQRACNLLPVLLRPPIGHKNVFLAPLLLERRMRCVTWTAGAMDTMRWDPVRLVERLLKQVRPGSILLLHDRVCGRPKMLDALHRLIEQLAARGYHFVRLPGVA